MLRSDQSSASNVNELTLKEFQRLFESFHGVLCLFANSYLNNTDTSKDIVQEVFIKVWEKKVVFPNDSAAKSYFYTSVRNRSLDYLNTKYNRVTDNYPIGDIEKLKNEEFFSYEVLRLEITGNMVENAIDTLPNKCAQIIRMVLRGYSDVEIADELSISNHTVRAQKRIAYQKLRNLLKA